MKVDLGRNRKLGPNRVVIHAYDCWSADHTLAMILHPLLKRVKADTRSTPCSVYDTLDEDISEEAHERAYKKWQLILDQMIFSMQEIANLEHNEPKMPKNAHWKEWKDETGRDRMEFIWDDEQERKKYEKETYEYQRKIQEGCELFGKHFRDLWT